MRRERLRKQAAQRSRVRRVERARKQGTLRFTLLALTIVITAVVVTIVMFETLALLRRLGRAGLRPSAGPSASSTSSLVVVPRRPSILLDLEVDLLAEDRNRARSLDADRTFSPMIASTETSMSSPIMML